MKNYELTYTKGETGVFRMSIVASPAVKSTLVFFSDEESRAMRFEDEEKHVIYSVAMRPNMLIPRKDINGEPAMVFYSEDTVRDLQQNFFKNNSHNGATINHGDNIEKDIYCFESWIVDDPEKDKATTLGLDVKKGDWVIGQKIDNPEVWQKIKNKEVSGFSIEAYLEPMLTDNKIEMDAELEKKIKRFIMEASLGKEYIVEEKKYYIDKLETGGKITDADGKEIPNLEIKIEDKEIKTDENGVIKETEKEEEMADEEVAKLKEDLLAKDEEIISLKAKISELEASKTQMASQIATGKDLLTKMSEEVKKGVKPGGAPEKKYEEMSNFEKAKFNKERR